MVDLIGLYPRLLLKRRFDLQIGQIDTILNNQITRTMASILLELNATGLPRTTRLFLPVSSKTLLTGS